MKNKTFNQCTAKDETDLSALVEYGSYTSLNFDKVQQLATVFADTIENKYEELVDTLLEYESFEVATDEIARSLDLLRNLSENKGYFELRVGEVTTFLPRNQPLYAFTCFVIVPSLMASKVHFRIPHSMKNFLPKVFELLSIFTLFPNIYLSQKERIEFLKERSAVLVNPITNESRPVSDVVIFTGTSAHADQLRLVFDRKTLFITNGAGHNPIVVTESAEVSNAVEAVLTIGLYNQGQDCAASNAILVHAQIYDVFMEFLHKEFKKIKIGPYKNRECRVGSISNPEDLKRIQALIVDNRIWLDEMTGGIIRTSEAIVEPTIVCKPLREGGNFEEAFAPILFIHKYDNDEELKLYFENPRYAQNAMYVTLFGESQYIRDLIGRSVGGKVLHLNDTFLHNVHLHIPGIERGTQPYGGYGQGASSISINGKVIARPTLPQRDIYEWVAKPLIDASHPSDYFVSLRDLGSIEYKNVEKILRLKSAKSSGKQLSSNDNIYLDIESLKIKDVRYVKIDEANLYHLLGEPNAEHIVTMEANDLKLVRDLKDLLNRKPEMSREQFTNALYAIPKKPLATEDENEVSQLRFFQHVYQLLFKKDRGPRLAPFLWDLNEDMLDTLLNV